MNDIIKDWSDPEIAKQLVFVKFCLENGGVSRNRSEDDAKTIIRYFHSQVIKKPSVLQPPKETTSSPTIIDCGSSPLRGYQVGW